MIFAFACVFLWCSALISLRPRRFDSNLANTNWAGNGHIFLSHFTTQSLQSSLTNIYLISVSLHSSAVMVVAMQIHNSGLSPFAVYRCVGEVSTVDFGHLALFMLLVKKRKVRLYCNWTTNNGTFDHVRVRTLTGVSSFTLDNLLYGAKTTTPHFHMKVMILYNLTSRFSHFSR